ncbi:MAG: TonB-dependent receptor [Lewinellaceae bacterium]|nr:TonB-dependent receptor [Lewinellaceae bacterium]
MTTIRFRTFLFCLVLSTGLSAQTPAWISGHVTDSDGKPLTFASVQVTNGAGATTDASGRFQLRVLATDSVQLQVRFIGFEPWSGYVALPTREDLRIVLLPVAFPLQTLELIGTWAEADAPFTQSRMDAADLEQLNLGQDMPFLLRFTPGVVATSDAGTGIGYTGIRVRGSDPTRTNITINGVPVNDPESQAVFWVNMPDLASSVDQIQVQRGAGTSTNGAGAFGATINMQTKTLRSEPYARLSSTVGSFNTRRATVELGTGLLGGHWALDGRWSAIDSDGYIDRATARLRSWYGSVAWQDSRTLVRLLAFSGRERTYQSWWGTPQSRLENDVEGMLAHAANNGLTPEQTDNLLESGRTYNYYQYKDEVDQYGQDNLQLHLSRVLTDRWRVNTTLHYTRGQGYFEQYRTGDDRRNYGLEPAIYGSDTLSVIDLVRRRWLDNDFAGVVTNLRYEAPRWNIHLGGAWNTYLGDHFGRIIWAEVAQGIGPDHEYYSGAGDKRDGNLFLKADWSPSSAWRLFVDAQVRHVQYQTSGVDNDLRSYDVQDDRVFFNPKAGVTWSLQQWCQLYASAAVAHREPSRSEYIDAPSGAFPRPERMVDVELGSRIAWAAWQLNFNGYWMDYTDQLVPTGALNDVGATLKVNVPDSYRLGLEVQAEGPIWADVFYQGSLGWSRNRIRAFDEVIYDYTSGFEEIRIPHRDVDIAYSPDLVYSHQVAWTFLAGWSLNWMSQYVSQHYLDNTASDDRAIPAWWVNDLQLRWARHLPRVGDLTVRFQVNNVLDKAYSSNGYTYSYIYDQLVTENFYYPQAGRNWQLGVQLSW